MVSDQLKKKRSRKNRGFDPEFKRQVTERILAGESVPALSKELKIVRQVLYRWRDAGRGRKLIRPVGRPRKEPVGEARSEQQRIAELRALRHAIAERQPKPGLIHHSDRGVQYACESYVAELKSNRFIGSMSRVAYPYDNAFCESFMRTLKEEEIYCSAYSTMEELNKNVQHFIEEYYNINKETGAEPVRSRSHFCPALRRFGAVTLGATGAEALRNINEVVQIIMEELREDGLELPATSGSDVEVFEGTRVAVTV